MSDVPPGAEVRPKTGALPLAVVDLGRMSYAAALEVQRQTHQRVLDGLTPPTLILVEHNPVITVSQRQSATSHLLASADVLSQMGIEVCPTDRGGDITYHGPGQLVAYPILRLSEMGMNVGRYMRWLEEVIIDVLARFDVIGQREASHTGVWVDVGPADAPQVMRLRKICAMGVRVRRNISLHGLALNVDTDMSHFATIVPCGLVGRQVTSLRQIMAERTPDMAAIKAALTARMMQGY